MAKPPPTPQIIWRRAFGCGTNIAMRYSDQLLDDIRARIRVSELVGRKVGLKRKGREFAGLSPFNQEKTPSFFVNDEKQFYHCFSSGKHGDIFKWMMEMEGLSFPEAVERLAGEAGVELPKATPQEVEREKKRAGLIDVMEMADQFFREQLDKPVAREARAYLERRGLKAATIAEFGIGYAPGDRQALRKYLSLRDITDAQMAEAGLIISGEDIREPYDRFRDRIMFPIGDVRGRTIAFGGRALSADVPAKYLNSPDTPLFHKGSIVYNFARARKPAFDAQAVLVAEGYMDVIALAQAGLPHAVAPLGTALTEDQIGLLWRLAPEPVLCFDGDRAGQAAAYRAAERALPVLTPGHSVRFAFLPDGKDPDDLVKTQGVEAMRDVISQAQPLYKVLWEKEVTGRRLDTPEQRAAFQRQVRSMPRQIRDDTVREHYAQTFEEQLKTLFGGQQGRLPQRGGAQRGGWDNRFDRSSDRNRSRGRGGFGRPALGATPSLKRSSLARAVGSTASRAHQLLVLTVLNHPWLVEDHVEALAGISTSDASLDSLLNEIIDVATQGDHLDRTALHTHLETHGLSHVAHRLLSDPTLTTVTFTGGEADPAVAEAGFEATLKECAADGLKADLQRAQADFEMDPSEENGARLLQIKRMMLEQGHHDLTG
ncbi:DNA primase [Pyruvatibacter mobilis]|uniref:DNA primase n=1 Tax=Pyruvatibacter mobilis TaxID=1712261 RepID=UPI003BAB0FCA